MATPNYQIEPGSPHPLGATPDADGVNFALFSEHATTVELLLFDTHDAPELFLGIALDPDIHRTFRVWHVYVRGLRPGCAYAYRVDGPRDTSAGHRFDPTKALLDPYALGNTTTHWDRARATGSLDNIATAMRSTVIDSADYDWQGDQPLKRPLHETIIYEVHVGGLTRAPSSGCTHPGTFAALVEKIPYLQALGVTAVELLPVCQFDPQDVARSNPLDGSPLTDFLHVMINMEDRKLAFDVPALDGRSWHRVIDTALRSPADIIDLDCAPAFTERTYPVDARSLVLLASR